MHEVVVAAAVFCCLLVSSLASLMLWPRFRSLHDDSGDGTLGVVRTIANFFVVMTSLLLGLMINSAKNTLDSVDRDVHAFSLNLILLDRSLQHYGEEAKPTRSRLLAYAEHAVRMIHEAPSTMAPRDGERLLDAVSASIKALRPRDAEQRDLLHGAHEELSKLVAMHWIVVGESRGTIPGLLVVMVVAWLTLVFASYGLRAPRNALVSGSFLVAALLLSGVIYLILDMDRPFTGAVQASDEPLLRAVTEMRQ